MRAVLGLHENVCTGAADGYARIAGQAALTLLHLGPGLANGLANLHNARRAHSPVVNVVGDHASWHLVLRRAADLRHRRARRHRGTVTTRSRSRRDRCRRPGRRLTTRSGPGASRPWSCRPISSRDRAGAAGRRVRRDRPRAASTPTRSNESPASCGPPRAGSVLLLGGNGLSRARPARRRPDRRRRPARCCTARRFPPGPNGAADCPPIDRLPYFPEAAVQALAVADAVVLAGARDPVAYFGYEGIPSALARPERCVRLAGPDEDAEQALVDAGRTRRRHVNRTGRGRAARADARTRATAAAPARVSAPPWRRWLPERRDRLRRGWHLRLPVLHGVGGRGSRTRC